MKNIKNKANHGEKRQKNQIFGSQYRKFAVFTGSDEGPKEINSEAL